MKLFKWAAGIFLGLITVVFIIGFIVHEKEPPAIPSREADELANQMLVALNLSAWDSTRYLSWNFMDRNRYTWDKVNHLVRYESGDLVVILNTQDQSGVAARSGERLSGKSLDKALDMAWRNFCNDGFWVYAPYKINDPGTSRSIVTVKDGREGLKVKYNNGGVTPGDSYVWFVNEEKIPTSFKIWVQILPIGGLEFQWKDWTTLSTGARIATKKSIQNFELSISDLRSGITLGDLELDYDPFQL